MKLFRLLLRKYHGWRASRRISRALWEIYFENLQRLEKKQPVGGWRIE